MVQNLNILSNITKIIPVLRLLTEILIETKINYSIFLKQEISKTLRSFNPKKSTDPGGTPQKILKYSANILDSYLTDFVYCDLVTLLSIHKRKVEKIKKLLPHKLVKLSLKILQKLLS